MNTLRLALRMLLRDWRAGELRVLLFALVLAVASVGTVGFFAERVKGALTRQANLLLGADVLISGDRPLPLCTPCLHLFVVKDGVSGVARNAKLADVEAEERRRKAGEAAPAKAAEVGGRDGPDPVRYGDWEKDGLASDF